MPHLVMMMVVVPSVSVVLSVPAVLWCSMIPSILKVRCILREGEKELPACSMSPTHASRASVVVLLVRLLGT